MADIAENCWSMVRSFADSSPKPERMICGWLMVFWIERWECVAVACRRNGDFKMGSNAPPHFIYASFEYSAVIVELIPPRGVNRATNFAFFGCTTFTKSSKIEFVTFS